MSEPLELIYIGREFYMQSSTMLSSIYQITGERSDWGFVQVALSEGRSISIRPATESEKEPYVQWLKTFAKNKNCKD